MYKKDVVGGEFWQVIFDVFNQVDNTATFTKTLFRSSSILQNVPSGQVDLFFMIAQMEGDLVKVGVGKDTEYKKIAAANWEQYQERLRHYYSERNTKTRGKETAEPAQVEETDEVVGIPKAQWENIQKVLRDVPYQIKQRDTKIEELTRKNCQLIDEMQEMKSASRGRKRVIPMDMSVFTAVEKALGK